MSSCAASSSKLKAGLKRDDEGGSGSGKRHAHSKQNARTYTNIHVDIFVSATLTFRTVDSHC